MALTRDTWVTVLCRKLRDWWHWVISCAWLSIKHGCRRGPSYCAHDFKALVYEVLSSEAASQQTEEEKMAFNSWSTAKQVLKPDIRYSKMPIKHREVLCRRYA